MNSSCFSRQLIVVALISSLGFALTLAASDVEEAEVGSDYQNDDFYNEELEVRSGYFWSKDGPVCDKAFCPFVVKMKQFPDPMGISRIPFENHARLITVMHIACSPEM